MKLVTAFLDTCRRSGGLGLLLGWMYCTFFSCGLVPHIIILRSSEHVWQWVGVGMAASALIIALLRTLRKSTLAFSKSAGVVGALCGAVGSCCIWLAFAGTTWNVALSTTGGLLAGVGLAIMAVIWGRCLSGFEVARLERTVPEAFIMAFALYFVLLAAKGALFLLACILMPLGSMFMAFHHADQWKCPFEKECACGPGKPMEATTGMQLRSMAPILLLHFVLWVQFSSFRLISSPDVVGDRFMHYLVPFSCAAVVAIVLFLLCIRNSRFLNYSLMYRWATPLMMLGCIIFLAGPNPWFDFRSVAYAANFVALFGVQLTLWVVTPKVVCRMGFNPVLAFCSFLFAEGAGIAVGLAFAMPAIGHETSLALMPLVITGIALLIAMSVGFMPEWFFERKAVNPLFAAKERGATATGFGAAGAAGASAGSDVGAAGGRGADAGVGVGAGAGANAVSAVDNKGGACLLGAFEASDATNAASIGGLPQAQGTPSLAVLFDDQARLLQKEYGLTERETQICALLLAGRSRPFIRDELIISLNTVHTHAHNIFQKCEVKSQQELMSLPEKLLEGNAAAK